MGAFFFYGYPPDKEGGVWHSKRMKFFCANCAWESDSKSCPFHTGETNVEAIVTQAAPPIVPIKKLPKAVASSELTILGVKLKCFVLDNGERVFDAESFAQFWAAMENSEIELTEEDGIRLAKFVRNQE